MPPKRRYEKLATCTLLVATALALAAALASGRAAGADVAAPCGTAATARTSTGTIRLPVEPYQRNLSQYRLANTSQYRLADRGQYRRSGALPCGVSGVSVATGPALRAAAASYHALIASTAKATGLQPDLLHAVVTVESAYNPRARSPKGAQGLMQLMPATAARYTVADPYDPEQNLKAGARHLRNLIAEFGNDLQLALAAYNAGEEAVRKYANRIPPYAETRDYVQRVLAHYHHRLTRP